MSNAHSIHWKNLPWKKFRQKVFRLQRLIWKAIRVGDKARARRFQKLLLKSRGAVWLAIRQVTQLNTGHKTAGIDGRVVLNFKERKELFHIIKANYRRWKHQGLRKVPIPKKDGTKRILKIPTIADRAWQALCKLAIEPAHEAIFHRHSYGFRPGRSTWDCQKAVFNNLSSSAKGSTKKVLELDIKKCFDRISHETMMAAVIAPQHIKQGLYRCLKAGTNPEFPNQGTPQGGVISPLLANIALDGIENIHPSVRYADDMVFFLKPKDDANIVLKKVSDFLAKRRLEVKQEKTRVVASTDGFDFLGWHFLVKPNGKFLCTPSKDNYQAFKCKVKAIVNNSNYGAKVKARKLAPVIRGWRQYHRYCDMSKHPLWGMNHDAFLKFNREKKQDRHSSVELVKQAFPTVKWKVNGFIKVQGNRSPYDGDTLYWSKRNSKLYDNHTARALKRQNHTCEYCGHHFIDGEAVELHHIDGDHNNWKPKNLTAIHRSCHYHIHMSNR